MDELSHFPNALKCTCLSVSGRRRLIRAPYKVHIFISIMLISLPNSMFDHLLESSHRDDFNNGQTGFGEEIIEVVLIEGNLMHLIWSSVN